MVRAAAKGNDVTVIISIDQKRAHKRIEDNKGKTSLIFRKNSSTGFY